MCETWKILADTLLRQLASSCRIRRLDKAIPSWRSCVLRGVLIHTLQFRRNVPPFVAQLKEDTYYPNFTFQIFCFEKAKDSVSLRRGRQRLGVADSRRLLAADPFVWSSGRSQAAC